MKAARIPRRGTLSITLITKVRSIAADREQLYYCDRLIVMASKAPTNMERAVLIAVDDSDDAEAAFDCKFTSIILCQQTRLGCFTRSINKTNLGSNQ